MPKSGTGDKLLGLLPSLVQDARFGLRMLRKDRVVSVAALLSISLAVGACTAAFSLLDALILRPLPVNEPQSLLYLSYPVMRSATGEDGFISDALYGVLREVSVARMDLFGTSAQGGLQPAEFGAGEEERIRVNWMSGDAFRILGIHAALGRLLTSEDDSPSADHRVAVLSHAFWMRRFGGSPVVLGQSFTFRGQQYRIAGIAQKDFSGLEPGYLTDLWIPRTGDQAARGPYSGWGRVWGRLAPGIGPEQARQALQAAFTNYRREHTDAQMQAGMSRDEFESYINSPVFLRSAARGSDSLFRWQFQRPLWILAIVAGLVLLIACSNVANLFIARAAARETEMAVRAAVGAGRFRLFQQALIESGILAAVACLIGVAFATFAAPAIMNLLAPPGFPAYLDLHLNGRLLAFVATLAVCTTVLVGLVPALRGLGASANEALKGGSGKHSGRSRMLRPLLATQTGFSFAVLFIAGLLLLTFQKLTNLDLGFAKNGVALFTIQANGFSQGDRSRAITQELLDRVRRYPGVQAASLSAWGLVAGPFAPMMIRPIRVPGQATESVRPFYMPVSPGFFETMQIRMLAGRDFGPRDAGQESGGPVIVNETFARQFFGGRNPVGQRIEQMDRESRFVPREVVGLVHDAKYNNLREPAAPTVYEPATGPAGTLEVRTAADPLALIAGLRQEIQRVDPALRVTNVTLQSKQIDNTLLSERLLALLAAFFAVVALVLAAVGLYGVLSYSVVRRTKEIGIRLALGAEPMRVVRVVTADIGLTLLLGIGAGMAGGLALSRVVANVLFEVKASDAWSLALPLALLIATSALAALGPALRASRVEPTVALRYE